MGFSLENKYIKKEIGTKMMGILSQNLKSIESKTRQTKPVSMKI